MADERLRINRTQPVVHVFLSHETVQSTFPIDQLIVCINLVYKHSGTYLWPRNDAKSLLVDLISILPYSFVLFKFYFVGNRRPLID